MNEQKAIEILQRALEDELQVDEACEFLSSLNERTEKKLCEMIHAVIHFVSDHDIRRVEYDQAQREFLQASLRTLQRGKFGT